MTYTQLRNTITSRFQDFWEPAALGVPVEYENRPFVQPRTGAWARLSVQFGKKVAGSVGKDHQRLVGVVFLQVFQRENEGTDKGRLAAEVMERAFDNQQFAIVAGTESNVTFDLTNLVVIGKTGDGWHQQNISVAFRADHYLGALAPGNELIVRGEIIL